MGGRVCVATENWSVQQMHGFCHVALIPPFFSNRWDLDPIEIIVLSLFTSSLPLAQSYDIPVFLPRASNTVAHRLLAFTLVENVTLVVLCNSEPPLTEVQKLAHQFWSVVRDKLCSLAMTLPRLAEQLLGGETAGTGHETAGTGHEAAGTRDEAANYIGDMVGWG